MSSNNDYNKFFNNSSFNEKTIKYSKNLVERIRTSPDLKHFLTTNRISSLILLNEIVPYSDYKFRNFGDEKLDMDELQEVLNLIVFSNEIEKLMMTDNVVFYAIGEDGEIIYKADKDAIDYFKESYGIELPEEFDFSILGFEDSDDNDDDSDDNDGDNNVPPYLGFSDN